MRFKYGLSFLFALAVSAAIIELYAPVGTAAKAADTGETLSGDANADGSISIADAVMLPSQLPINMTILEISVLTSSGTTAVSYSMNCSQMTRSAINSTTDIMKSLIRTLSLQELHRFFPIMTGNGVP